MQDPAAKLSVICAQISENSRVLDCCAAPGGKSFAAAVAMQGRGAITSCDVYEHKTKLIAAGAARLGLNNLSVRHLDATVFVPEWENRMDANISSELPSSLRGGGVRTILSVDRGTTLQRHFLRIPSRRPFSSVQLLSCV